MQILIVDMKFGSSVESRVTDCVPRVGDHVDVFFTPAPRVERVLFFPSDVTIGKLGISGFNPANHFTAIVYVV